MENKWVSVKDRLPENGRDVLITNGSSCSIAFVFSGYDYWTYYMEDDIEPTHWMNLPEPPNE